ncbi:Cloroperoxidase [Fomitiporia mediterranea MF3/22]|uniref:Cloroperoxidase n=1 Tax=Fomitiporia mediterranea (strain MF3/22) TaxID=694068 RepID=UPI00044095FE|nr:Cloroperoxidase [Fomitiporia mediterranea MF3/22]EJD06093.1 Cloroperoxidase [Fomitiporia mediterranea MF3/22]
MSSTTIRNPYVSAGPGDSRSPCPALNALANHGYIPHSGRSIPFFQLVKAIRTVYNCSLPLALVLSVVGFLWCGHITGSGFSMRLALDLHDLARHNHIEHDGSLGHADVTPGELYAPVVPDPTRLASLLNAGSVTAKGPGGAGALTLYDLARVRYLRDSELARPLDPVHSFITRGELALILLAMGVPNGENAVDRVVPRQHLEQWFAEERLPDGWDGPNVQIGLLNTGKLGKSVKSEVDRIARYS